MPRLWVARKRKNREQICKFNFLTKYDDDTTFIVTMNQWSAIALSTVVFVRQTVWSCVCTTRFRCFSFLKSTHTHTNTNTTPHFLFLFRSQSQSDESNSNCCLSLSYLHYFLARQNHYESWMQTKTNVLCLCTVNVIYYNEHGQHPVCKIGNYEIRAISSAT